MLNQLKDSFIKLSLQNLVQRRLGRSLRQFPDVLPLILRLILDRNWILTFSYVLGKETTFPARRRDSFPFERMALRRSLLA